MAFPNWVCACGAGLALAFGFGCAPTHRQVVREPNGLSPAQAPKPAETAESLPAPPPTTGSPYQAMMPATGEAVSRASHPSPPRPTLLPPAPELTVRPVNAAKPERPGEAVRVEARTVPAPLPPLAAQPLSDPPLVAALRCYLNHRPAEAITQLERYDKPNQELLLGLLPVAARLTELSLTKANPQEMTPLVEQVESLLIGLRGRASLQLTKACFCRRIGNFGSYAPLPPDWAFQPGDWVEVYAELQNFTTEIQGSHYVTRLASVLEIRDFNERVVWEQIPEAGNVDRSLSPRHDFYNKYVFQVPRDLVPGPYTLWIRITDLPTGRTARRSLDFRVTTLAGRSP
jgi:hypothetical protein